MGNEGYFLEFTIQGLPKIITNGSHGHWRTRWAHAQKWKKLVIEQVVNCRPKEPLTKARITLIRCSSHAPDADGLVGSFKPILDGLVTAGVLVDDSLAIIGMPDYQWEKCKPKKGHIIVCIYQEFVPCLLLGPYTSA